MDPKLLQLIQEAVDKGLTSHIWLLILVVVIGSGSAVFFSAYLKKRGEQRAHDEVIGKLNEQIIAQTRETEAIKGQIAKDVAMLQASLTENVQFKTGILTPRLEAYKSLWAKTYVVRPTRQDLLTDLEKDELRDGMTSWYYADGNGIFLSLEAGNLWRTARSSLSGKNDEVIKKAFSALRTRLKHDIRVYGLVDTAVELGT